MATPNKVISELRSRTTVSVKIDELRRALGKPDLRLNVDMGEVSLKDVAQALADNGNLMLQNLPDELAERLDVTLPAEGPPPEPPAPPPPSGGTGPADVPSEPATASQPPIAVTPSGEATLAEVETAVQPGATEQTEAESDLDADAPTRPRQPQPTQDDLGFAEVLDGIQARLRDIPADHWVATRFPNGQTVRLYRPPMRKKVKLRVQGRTQSFYAYLSLDPRNGWFDKDDTKLRYILVSPFDYERYQSGGDWSLRHMPFVTDRLWNELKQLFRAFSTFTETCRVGGEPFDPLLKSKIRMFLRKARSGPFSQARPDDALLFPRQCHIHWVMEQSRDEIQDGWMQTTLELQGLRGDPEAMKQAREDRMEETIRQIHKVVSERNHRVTLSDVADAYVAYAESITQPTSKKET